MASGDGDDPDVRRLVEKLGEQLGARVQILRGGGGKGRLPQVWAPQVRAGQVRAPQVRAGPISPKSFGGSRRPTSSRQGPWPARRGKGG